MREHQFYLLYIGIMLLLGLFFYFGRRKPTPPSSLKVSPPAKEPQFIDPRRKSVDSQRLIESVDQHLLRDRGCPFMFNGHTWDAFEVLGVSRSASIEDIRKVFESSIQGTHPNSHDFLKAALAAILIEIRDRGPKE